jgi:hypothetical protein
LIKWEHEVRTSIERHVEELLDRPVTSKGARLILEEYDAVLERIRLADEGGAYKAASDLQSLLIGMEKALRLASSR